jgi:hypothetical protein
LLRRFTICVDLQVKDEAKEEDSAPPVIDTKKKVERLPVLDIDLEEEPVRVRSPSKATKPAELKKAENQISSIESQISDIEALLVLFIVSNSLTFVGIGA